ncbi:MAG: hypothetical protein AB1941_01645 [Gemmatimonadota bacterium]
MDTRHFLILAIAALLAACRAGADDAPTSGDVARWAVDSIPALDIPSTGPDGNPTFLFAAAATQLSNGVVAVADPYDSSIHFFDPSGELVRTVGRLGEGPGEFNSPWWLRQCGQDAVFVWDKIQGQMTLIDKEGRVIREFRQTEMPLQLACSRAGAIGGISLPPVIGFPNAETPHYKGQLWVADTHGEKHLAGVVPAGENRPMGLMSHLALSADRLYLGTGVSDSIQVYTLDGKPAGILSLKVPRRRPTARNYERAIDEQVAMLPGHGLREEGKRMLLEIPMPRYLPTVSGLFTDPQGWVWGVVSGPGDAATELRGVSSDGRRLADLRIPEEIRVFEVGSDYVLGAHEDADGEQRIVRYTFQRRD